MEKPYAFYFMIVILWAQISRYLSETGRCDYLLVARLD